MGKEKEAASSSSTCGPGLFVVVSRRTVWTVEFPSYPLPTIPFVLLVCMDLINGTNGLDLT